MANLSDVLVRVIPKKGEVVFDAIDFGSPEWSVFSELFCESSFVCKGVWLEQDHCFETTGRWNFLSQFDNKHTRAYLAYLRDHGYDGVQLEFMDFETGCSCIGFGRLDVALTDEEAIYLLSYVGRKIGDFGVLYGIEESIDQKLTYEERVWEKGFHFFQEHFSDMLLTVPTVYLKRMSLSIATAIPNVILSADASLSGLMTKDSVYLNLETIHEVSSENQENGVHRFNRTEAENIVFKEWGYDNWLAFFKEYDDSSVEWLLQNIGKHTPRGK